MCCGGNEGNIEGIIHADRHCRAVTVFLTFSLLSHQSGESHPDCIYHLDLLASQNTFQQLKNCLSQSEFCLTVELGLVRVSAIVDDMKYNAFAKW